MDEVMGQWDVVMGWWDVVMGLVTGGGQEWMGLWGSGVVGHGYGVVGHSYGVGGTWWVNAG